MYEEEIHFWKLLLRQSETVLSDLTPVTLTFDPVNPKAIGFICYPGRMCRPSLRIVGNGDLKYLIENVFCTFDPNDLDLCPCNHKINRVHLLPWTNVWTKFDEGRSRRSRVIDLKWKGYRRTDTPTCAKQYALSSSKGAWKNKNNTAEQPNINMYTYTVKLVNKDQPQCHGVHWSGLIWPVVYVS